MSMDRRIKLVAVTFILFAGIACALIFRRHAAAPVSDATRPGTEVVRRDALTPTLPPLNPPLSAPPASATEMLMPLPPGGTSNSGLSGFDVRPNLDGAANGSAQKLLDSSYLPLRNGDSATRMPAASLDAERTAPDLSATYAGKPAQAAPVARLLPPKMDSVPLSPEFVGGAGELGAATYTSRTHKVVDGDSLSKIAAKYLGRADRYQEIFQANRNVLAKPDLLPIGVELRIPPRDNPAGAESTQLAGQDASEPPMQPLGNLSLVPLVSLQQPAQARPAIASKPRPKTYTVRGGETLVDISKMFYGTPSRATELFLANRSHMLHPRDLKPGTVVNLP